MRKMGINNFKPSIHHKVQSGHKVFNILNDPMIALVSPRIECQWENGMPPRIPANKRLNRKLQDEYDDTLERPHSEMRITMDEINNQRSNSPKKRRKKAAKKLAQAKARRVARQDGGNCGGGLISGESSPAARNQ